MPRLSRLLILVLAAAVSSCAPTRPAQRKASAPATPAAVQTEPPVQDEKTSTDPGKPDPQRKIALFFIAHPDGNPNALLNVLEAEPRLRMTIVFPPNYFDVETRKAAAARFKVLQSSKQIEVALTLANEPILPLIENLASAGPAVEKWGVQFSWPEDVATQIARGSGAYQVQWSQLPSGFFPPYGSASQRVIEVSRRFRLNWILLGSSDVWGVRFVGGTAVLVPQTLSSGDESQSAAAVAETAVRTVLARPFSVVDSANWPTPDHEQQFMRSLARAAKTQEFDTATPFVSRLKTEYALPAESDPFAQDFSPWVRSLHQKRAWQALADARKIVEDYKNSGRANLSRLDAAIEEICLAESGPFLLTRGEAQEVGLTVQRNFLATLANVYRLAGVPVPANLNTWFADRSVHRGSTGKSAGESDRPFFVEGSQKLTWNDPRGDDNGTGSFSYPAGAGPKGLFDLRDLTISWTVTDVTITIGTVEAPGQTAPMLPAADIYIDVNRIPDAGSTAVIRQRGKGALPRDAAWEYAVSLSPRAAVLYQGLPGGERIMTVRPAAKTTEGFSGTFPRSSLRGDPRSWRIAVGLGATEPSHREEPPIFIPILPVASPKAFGGASAAQQPPRYIDLLAPTAEVQATKMKMYETGTVSLPFVEAE